MVWTLISNAISHITIHNGEDVMQITFRVAAHEESVIPQNRPKIAICHSPVLEPWKLEHRTPSQNKVIGLIETRAQVLNKSSEI